MNNICNSVPFFSIFPVINRQCLTGKAIASKDITGNVWTEKRCPQTSNRFDIHMSIKGLSYKYIFKHKPFNFILQPLSIYYMFSKRLEKWILKFTCMLQKFNYLNSIHPWNLFILGFFFKEKLWQCYLEYKTLSFKERKLIKQ